ncbi:MAG TPA: TIGR04053 family radical SAM/SPASM domain-containing protein [Ktedonobacterales bacterium]
MTATERPYQPARGGSYLTQDFDRSPFTVAWEITRSCALACVHCRAEAIPKRDPRELTTDEARNLIDQVVDIGKPILVVTGGDPMMRRDVYDLLEYGVSHGLRMALSPSATALVTHRALERVRDIGVSMVHISLDGADAAAHDRFRGVAGSFERTMRILRDCRELGLSVQIGTSVARRNLAELPAIAARVREAEARVWSLFFLVPTGRGRVEDMIAPQEQEAALDWLYDISRDAPFHVRTAVTPAYRRVVIQRRREEERASEEATSATITWEQTGAGYSFRQANAPTGQGVNDGKGFCFISHIGDVYPSGFLQLSAGNVRKQSLSSIYRDSTLFRELRDPALLKGACGQCEFRAVCGGSRARAYAMTGDYLASDPSCPYIPKALRGAHA